jgi:5-methylcytosine-specific restriction endonuclease McrA
MAGNMSLTLKGGCMNWNSWIRSQLRRVWLRSPMRTQALRDARVARGAYKCAECGEIFKVKEIQVDHIIPAGTLIGDLGGFVERLFCPAEGLAVKCKPCHAAKTKNK